MKNIELRGELRNLLLTFICVATALCSTSVLAQRAMPIPVVIDLDIGDDIDDSFALALVLQSPAFAIRGISTAWGDTGLRARMVTRLLGELGRNAIPIATGIQTKNQNGFTHAR